MSPEAQSLWQKIESFSIDSGDPAFSFARRLARENGWTRAYTERVLIEYKKFLFLCCIHDGGVTPSDAVDQAWHLHLTYTRSYWVELCRHTLGRELHHNPTKGGIQEAVRYDGYYTDTRALYRRVFGTEPPADIWPPNGERFRDIHFQRVNLRRNWVIRKPRLRRGTAIVGCLCFFGLLGIQATMDFMPVVLIACLVIVVISFFRENGNGGKGGNGAGCSTAGCASTGCGHSHHGHSGCSSGCSGCSSSGCSGCGGGD